MVGCRVPGSRRVVPRGVARRVKQSASGAGLVGMSSATSDADWRELRATAFAALEHAYAPYSRFRVGAAVRSRDGRVYSGCNVENASYPASMCAERVAIATAVADGARDFVALVIAADAAEPAPPCGFRSEERRVGKEGEGQWAREETRRRRVR